MHTHSASSMWIAGTPSTPTVNNPIRAGARLHLVPGSQLAEQHGVNGS